MHTEKAGRINRKKQNAGHLWCSAGRKMVISSENSTPPTYMSTAVVPAVLLANSCFELFDTKNVADAKLFVGGEEGVDQDATVETFELVAGLSSIAFGAAFNVPFIVAPSVLYAPREDG